MISLFIAAAFASELSTKFDGSTFNAKLPDGFHFNLEAPNQLTVDGRTYRPSTASAHAVAFKFDHEKYTSARASLYVCDDALTFCRPETLEFGTPQASVAEAHAARPVTRNEFGFIQDNLDAAAAQAVREKKRVLIDFSARWCPGCIRLENEVFGTKAFKDATKDVVKVRLDFDRFENLELAKKYGVHAIPSLIETTASLDEISRVVDYQPMPVLAAFLKDARETPLSFDDLKSALGHRLYMSGQYAKAIPFLKDPELTDAKVQAAKRTPEFEKVVREAIAQEPSSSRSIVWRTDLVEVLKDSAEKKKIGEEGLAVGDDILKNFLMKRLEGDPIGEFAGFERMYVASERADLAESAGLDEATQAAALEKVTAIARESKIPLTAKGPSLRYLIFLVAAKQWSEAETQARAMIKLDPKNPELQRRLLRVQNGLKKYDEAIVTGRELLPNSFGKNEVWVAQQLAKAYTGAGKTKEAHALAQSFLARTDIDWSSMSSEQKDLQTY